MKPELKKNGDLPAFAGAADQVLFHPTSDMPAQTIRYHTTGLTKRELFAAMAMQGFAADPNASSGCARVAELAVEWADALLAELAKEQP